MNIVTFYNYPDEDKYFDMLKIWLMCVIESKKKTSDIKKIIIITEKLSDRFSQFINNDFNNYNKVGIGLLAGIIDTVWYILVSYSVNLPRLKNYIILNQKIIFLFFGFILIIYSIYLVIMSIEYFI